MIKIALIGLGHAGSSHLINYHQLEESIEITAIDVDNNKRDFAEQHNAKFSTDIDSVLNNQKFDLIDICLPTYLHHSIAKKAIDTQPRAILIEKPLALNYKQAKELTHKVQEKKILNMCAHVERFFNPMIEIKKKLNLPAKFRFERRTKKPNRSTWFTKPELGGDVLLDLGIHDLDLLLWFTNSSISEIKVQGNSSKVISQLKLYDGSQAKVISGWDLPEKAEYELDNSLKISNQCEIEYYDRENTLTIGGETQLKGERWPQAYQQQLKHMIECIKKDKQPKITFIEASKVIKLIDKIREKLQ